MKDLQGLINKYNEPGIMIDFHKHVYWFNGKRFEFFLKHNESDMLYYKNQFYFYHLHEIVTKSNCIPKILKILAVCASSGFCNFR